MTTSEGGGVVVPERSAIPIVYRADDPIAVPLTGLPSMTLWMAHDRFGVPQWSHFDRKDGMWRLAAEGTPGAVLVRIGKDWSR